MAHTDIIAAQTSSTVSDQDLGTTSESGPKQVLSSIYPPHGIHIHPRSATTMALEQYRLQLYNYALNIERFRCPQYVTGGTNGVSASWVQLTPYGQSSNAGSGSSSVNNPAINRMSALSTTFSLFPQTQHRIFQPEEPKPQHSYIGLIAMAILSSTDIKLVLSDIYQYILDNYPYFRSRGPGWRNSIRHNLSLNDCFIKSGRSANGKGHYWAIHPANMDDFRKGDFRRRKAQRKVRKHMGLSVDDASTGSPSPPPLDLTTPPPVSGSSSLGLGYPPYHHHQQYIGQFFNRNSTVVPSCAPAYHSDPSLRQQSFLNLQEPAIPLTPQHQHIAFINSTTTTTIANMFSQTRKRQFDVASLLAPDIVSSEDQEQLEESEHHHTVITKQTIHREVVVGLEQQTVNTDTTDPDVDVEVVDEGIDHDPDLDQEPYSEQKKTKREATMKETFSDNISYLSDDPDQDPEHNYSARSLGDSSSSQHEESSSLEECPVIDPVLPIPNPAAYIELNQVDPHILSRYYGTYMAAAARRAGLEASKSVRPSPKLEIVSQK
ncbi:uncharacterized protein fd102C [Drosophila kikkawai]|uniref:Uncharacterized protein fd102C n=1 Tax=Drosophila kikkawai TaxID=30033 RepID=A0ABM3C7C4_DROKI|nr:forkhead box protein I1c [Drosophila kikkawai]XP_041632589.1 forkhead box protein I1c [Drosophila kikkawai]KAH8308505.1 hypothetical protein KR059_002333 [Drosophila kikkawai]